MLTAAFDFDNSGARSSKKDHVKAVPFILEDLVAAIVSRPQREVLG